MAFLAWRFGPPQEPDKITGQDIFTIHDGKIWSLIIFIDGLTRAMEQH